ncbi:MAG TPA: hypothetical protein VFP95_07165 [Gammaproteobacteria bacterium]|nr:hypothetical protein [Gammaproteobacteria bacterium]
MVKKAPSNKTRTATVATKRRSNPNRGSKPGERRGGRKKGTPNKVTAGVRDMILHALNKAGGERYLVEQARENPTAFLTLVGKILPKAITGADGGPIEHAHRLDKEQVDAVMDAVRGPE